jgi:membrane-bound serine protease (ClpP class)
VRHSFISGALILFNTVEVPGFPRVSIPLVVGTGIFLAASFMAIVTLH